MHFQLALLALKIYAYRIHLPLTHHGVYLSFLRDFTLYNLLAIAVLIRCTINTTGGDLYTPSVHGRELSLSGWAAMGWC